MATGGSSVLPASDAHPFSRAVGLVSGQWGQNSHPKNKARKEVGDQQEKLRGTREHIPTWELCMKQEEGDLAPP